MTAPPLPLMQTRHISWVKPHIGYGIVNKIRKQPPSSKAAIEGAPHCRREEHYYCSNIWKSRTLPLGSVANKRHWDQHEVFRWFSTAQNERPRWRLSPQNDPNLKTSSAIRYEKKLVKLESHDNFIYHWAKCDYCPPGSDAKVNIVSSS